MLELAVWDDSLRRATMSGAALQQCPVSVPRDSAPPTQREPKGQRPRANTRIITYPRSGVVSLLSRAGLAQCRPALVVLQVRGRGSGSRVLVHCA